MEKVARPGGAEGTNGKALLLATPDSRQSPIDAGQTAMLFKRVALQGASEICDLRLLHVVGPKSTTGVER